MLKTLLIEITNVCNRDCDFCYSKNLKRKPQHMEIKLFKKIIGELADNKITKSIGYHVLGEPLLHPKLQEMLKISANRGMESILVTNGILLTEKAAKRIIESKVSEVKVSLQAGAKSPHKIAKIFSNSGTRLTYQYSVYEMDSRFLKKRIEDENGGALKDFFSNLTETLNQKISIDKIMKTGIEKAVRISKNISFETSFRFTWPGAGSEIQKCKGYCHFPFESAGILSNGKIVLCCLDAEGATAFGDINKTTIKNALKSQRRMEVLKCFKEGTATELLCRNCLALKPAFLKKIRENIEKNRIINFP